MELVGLIAATLIVLMLVYLNYLRLLLNRGIRCWVEASLNVAAHIGHRIDSLMAYHPCWGLIELLWVDWALHRKAHIAFGLWLWKLLFQLWHSTNRLSGQYQLPIRPLNILLADFLRLLKSFFASIFSTDIFQDIWCLASSFTIVTQWIVSWALIYNIILYLWIEELLLLLSMALFLEVLCIFVASFALWFVVIGAL